MKARGFHKDRVLQSTDTTEVWLAYKIKRSTRGKEIECAEVDAL